jgi:hypothetical protein
MSGTKTANESKRKSGGQPGNRNAWKHGRRSKGYKLEVDFSKARLKVVAMLGRSLGMFENGIRDAPMSISRDELALLMVRDPELYLSCFNTGLITRNWNRSNSLLHLSRKTK